MNLDLTYSLSYIPILIFLLTFGIGYCSYNANSGKPKQFGSYIRRQFEEPHEVANSINKNDKDSLVSFLFDNVNEVFGGTVKTTKQLNTKSSENSNAKSNTTSESTTITTSYKNISLMDFECTLATEISTATRSKKNVRALILTEDEMNYENLTITTNDLENIERTSQKAFSTILRNNRNIKNKFIDDQVNLKILDKNGLLKENKLSCIICDNVNNENCNDPKNKLISSKICDNVNDICYSMHTPFGIVDRGCYNMDNNISTYVCSCNLCNYIPISEMPFVIADKRSWVDNVIKMSRSKRLRQTIFSQLDCLVCEVTEDSTLTPSEETLHCLDGNMAHLWKKKCSEGEICAVKSIRSTGYFWRGCVKSPLYNYWWRFCDSDLCNIESLISMYDNA